ncbi:hypothetical protein [Ekhidna sp.]
MKYLILSFFLFFCTQNASSQDGVGIGRPDPDPSAVLHISAPAKGVLFPRTSPLIFSNINSTSANGLFIYDNVFNRYAYLKDGVWMYLNPWDTQEINLNNTTGNPEDILSISTPYEVRVNNDLSADHFDGFGVVPIGGIIMWSGPIAEIPSNYRRCIAGQGTYTINGVEYNVPNLNGRFIRAAASPDVVTGGGVNTTSTTQISYVETPRYTIQEPTCSEYQFIYTVSWIADCEGDGGSPSPFDFIEASVRANSCFEAFSEILSTDWADRGCITIPVTYDNCSASPNPNYYLTRAACRNNDVEELNVATGTENRPSYYDLTYIIRVE